MSKKMLLIASLCAAVGAIGIYVTSFTEEKQATAPAAPAPATSSEITYTTSEPELTAEEIKTMVAGMKPEEKVEMTTVTIETIDTLLEALKVEAAQNPAALTSVATFKETISSIKAKKPITGAVLQEKFTALKSSPAATFKSFKPIEEQIKMLTALL